MDHSLCALGFVSRPMRVSLLSCMRSGVSSSGAFIFFLGGESEAEAKLFPFFCRSVARSHLTGLGLCDSR